MYKWLTITGIVCLGFIVVLLGLGYLLKENEVAVTALKRQLDEQQSKVAQKNSPTAHLTFVDKEQEALDKLAQYKNIITKNVTCTSANQCVLINTQETSLGCLVSVNTIGAALLMKAINKASENNVITNPQCEPFDKNLGNICQHNICQVVVTH